MYGVDSRAWSPPLSLWARIFCGLCLVSLCVAQPRANLRGPQYRFCACSFTHRGYRREVYTKLLDSIDQLDELVNELKSEPPEISTNKLNSRVNEYWNNCIASYSYEQCVNADAALRLQSCGANCASFCIYDPGTWRSNAGGSWAPSCLKSSQWADTDPDITGNKFPHGIMPSPTNPNPGISGPASASITKPIKTTTTTTTTVTKQNSNNNPKPKQSNHHPADSTGSGTVNSQNKNNNNRGPSSTSVGSGNGVKKPRNVNPTNNTKTGKIDLTMSQPKQEDMFAPEPPPSIGATEGCIAVRHLEGLPKQHRTDLWRTVLCARGFCATPNHAIIVHGRWTSMRKLCAHNPQWQCIRSVQFVNNLDVFRVRRAIVYDITITPYDDRFPRIAVFFVQALEKFLYAAGDIISHILVTVPIAFTFAIHHHHRHRQRRRQRQSDQFCTTSTFR